MKKPISFFVAISLALVFSIAQAQSKLDENNVREAVLLDVQKQGLNKLPEVQNAIREAQDLILIRAWEKSMLLSQPVTQDMKDQIYKELKILLGDLEYRVFQVFLDKEEAAQALIKGMLTNPNWEELNIKALVPANVKYSANKPEWINISSILPEFRAVVKSLKVGEVATKPIPVQTGWHVVGLLQTRPLNMPSPEKMDKELVNLAERKILGQRLQELLKNNLKRE